MKDIRILLPGMGQVQWQFGGTGHPPPAATKRGALAQQKEEKLKDLISSSCFLYFPIQDANNKVPFDSDHGASSSGPHSINLAAHVHYLSELALELPKDQEKHWR